MTRTSDKKNSLSFFYIVFSITKEGLEILTQRKYNKVIQPGKTKR